MAKVFNPPSSIPQPEFDFKEFNNYLKGCDEYRAKLKAYVTERKKGQYIGEIITFNVADGYAEYMVASLSPVELIHIPLGDAWQSENAHLMTAKAIKEKIEQQKKLAKIFGGK